ncbi:universal stress protein [Neptunomonas concharum]|uniref:UspA domain-containing protein n=1 Tax=Neptunomonas concharum TaxID=1031538 RepID=A0A5P1RAR0_9GAMM|nr:universal stress protein [Neptunomonas concharum]QEQ96376.1 hypothetical protein F0U83_06465 [Neptunomonas concharum]
MGLNKVLVDIDPKNPSGFLLEKVKRIAAGRSLHIELFHNCYSRSLHNSYLFDREAEKHAIAGYQQHVEAQLIQLSEAFEGEGYSVGYDVSWNKNSAEGLIKKALRYQADLVISSISKHSLGHYLLGQGDWKLISECPIPLLMTKERGWGVHPRVLAAVDPFHPSEVEKASALDAKIIEAAIEFSRLMLGELHGAHCFNVLPQSAIFDEHLTADYEGLQEKVRSQHKKAFGEFLDHHAKGQILEHLIEGEVHNALPELVEKQKIDVLVMGSAARDMVDRLLVGSSVERVLDHIPCDVLLVKKPGFVSPVTE